MNAPSCPLLNSYWHFHGCNYQKSTRACSRPDLIDGCSLPTHQFRNGNLNQLAYSLFLFNATLPMAISSVGWMLVLLKQPGVLPKAEWRECQTAIMGPLVGVHGASNKVLNMALADFLIVGAEHNPVWGEVGAGLIAIDTLVAYDQKRTCDVDFLQYYDPKVQNPQPADPVQATADDIESRWENRCALV